MRNAVGIFGGLAGAIVVALVGRYGFVTSDTRLDGAIAAFFFAVIAIGGIGGPAVAVNLFRTAEGWAKTWGLIAGVIAGVALLANLSNSLGAIAGRADKTIAERTNASEAVKDARAELKRLTHEREKLPAFTPAGDEDVTAARQAVAAAEKASKAECGDGGPTQRGARCLQREAEERAKRGSLAGILTNKGLTDQAAKIDASAAAERRKVSTTAPVGSVNPMAETLARILRIPPGDAATWQQVATVIVVELLIAFSLIAWELLTPQRGAAPVEAEVIKPRRSATRRHRRALGSAVALIEANLVPGDVAQFAVAHLRPANGASLAIVDLYEPYKVWCRAQDASAVSEAQFEELFAGLCKLSGFGRADKNGKAHCLGLQLAA